MARETQGNKARRKMHGDGRRARTNANDVRCTTYIAYMNGGCSGVDLYIIYHAQLEITLNISGYTLLKLSGVGHDRSFFTMRLGKEVHFKLMTPEFQSQFLTAKSNI